MKNMKNPLSIKGLELDESDLIKVSQSPPKRYYQKRRKKIQLTEKTK